MQYSMGYRETLEGEIEIPHMAFFYYINFTSYVRVNDSQNTILKPLYVVKLLKSHVTDFNSPVK